MPDLHTALEAAITARLGLARVDARRLGTTSARLIVAYCERDLKVLERHKPFDQKDWSMARGSFTEPGCEHCELTSNDGDPLARDWPCDDIADLLDVYPEVTRP